MVFDRTHCLAWEKFHAREDDSEVTGTILRLIVDEDFASSFSSMIAVTISKMSNVGESFSSEIAWKSCLSTAGLAKRSSILERM